MVATLLAAVGVLAVLAAVGAPSPNAVVSTSTNACSACHSGAYTMYVRIDSYTVPATTGSDAATVSVVVSVTGNEASKPATAQSYYTSALTVSAASQSGLLTIAGSPKSYSSVKPEYSQTVSFTVTGKTSGTDTIVFTVKMRPGHNSGDTTRTITARASIDVAINVPPVLSGGSVSPGSGSPADAFAFSVVYRDANGDVPQQVTMTLDGTPHAMAPADGVADTPVAGETYSATLPGADIGEGASHSFAFSASDGKAAATGDTGAHAGPTVAVDHPPVVAITYPTGGQLGGAITVTGTASDPDAGGKVDRVEVTVGAGAAQVAAGTSGWSLGVDLSALPDGPLAIRAVAWGGGLSSAEARVDITVSNTVTNIPPVVSIGLPNGTLIAPVAWINGTVYHPEPDQGAPRVLVGVGAAPSMAANVTQGPDGWHWSIMLDLSGMPEGTVTVSAVASDPFTSSPVDVRTVVLTPPESNPSVSVDAVGSPLWGTVTLTGTATDPDSTVMRARVSIDGGPSVPVEVVADRWTYTVDVTSLGEGEHTLSVVGSDGRIDVSANAAFLVGRPVVHPVGPAMGTLEPAGPVNATVDDVVTFRALFTPGDALGTTVAWTYDGQPMDATPVDGGTELAVELTSPGNHTVAVTIAHALAAELSVSNEWLVSVADAVVNPPPPPPPPPPPRLTVLPVGSSDVEAVVGQVVILQYEVVEGTVASREWTVDGAAAGTGPYLAYMPTQPGLHAVGFTAWDPLSNSSELVFRVFVTAPTAPDATADPSAGTPAALSPVGAATIGALVMLLVAVTAWAVGRTMGAREKSRKHTASHQARDAKVTGEDRADKGSDPVKAAEVAKMIAAKKAQRAATAATDGASRAATPRAPREDEGSSRPEAAKGPPPGPASAPVARSPKADATPPSRSTTAAPTYNVIPIPMVRPCLACGGRTVFDLDKGAYWCHACAAFHPVNEETDVDVQWSEGGAS
jgi:hypothetical protein